MSKISDLFSPRCVHRHTAAEHPKCFIKGKPVSVKANVLPAVLVFDVETLPILGFSWGVWNQDIHPAQIVNDWCILSYSAKWLGEDRIISDTLTPQEAVNRNDGRLVKDFWKLLDYASIVITHNGKRFDIKKLNTRFWHNKLHPTSSYKVIDTLVTAKAVFGMTYNKLDYIAKYQGLQQKLDTDMELWIACHYGDKNALTKMREYNEQDVIIQEEVYRNMREWIPNHPNFGNFNELGEVCPVCVGKHYSPIGLYHSNYSSLKYTEYRCNDCGAVWHDTKAVKEN